MSLTDSSEDSDESESSNDCVIVEDVKARGRGRPKLKPKIKAQQKPPNVRTIESLPNIMQFKSHFTPGKAFDGNDLVKSQSSVRKRKDRTKRESIEEKDYDSDETVIDEDFAPDDWRNGPAKRWYDMIGLPEDCTECDYGFKLKPQSSCSPPMSRVDSEDAFNLVSQISWEKNVIWDSDAVRQRVMKNVEKPSIAGWIPVEEQRTAPEFFKPMDDNTIDKLIANDFIPKEVIIKCNENKKCDKTNGKTINGLSKNLRKRKANSCDNESENVPKKASDFTHIKEALKWVSTLHEENRELTLNRWEEDIIWDPNSMTRIPEPKIIPFSNNDDNAIIEWNDFDENSNDSNHNSMADTLRQLSLNISNDEFYASVVKADNSATHSLLITHSIPAKELHDLCFPSWDPDFLRPPLKRSRKLMPRLEHNVLLCSKQNFSLSSDTQNSRDLSKFLIKNISQLTARNGQLVLMEYSEEAPPLRMRVGMGSQLLNYFNKTKDKNFIPEEHRFAQTKAVTTSPFIGEMGGGRSQLALETNMFRSPIWEHTCPDTDFLIIRTEQNYYIRDIDGLFVVGQTLPLMECPRLRSKGYYNFTEQFAKLFIYRFFNGRKSVTNLSTELSKAFPHLNQHFAKKVLRLFTVKEYDRHRLKSEIPFDNQINELLTPENYCAYYSTAITAATTLKEMNVGDRLYLDEKQDDCDKVDEMAFAPWNTTFAYIQSLNARKWLNVSDHNEDGSIVFKTQSYKEFKDKTPAIKKCVPLSDLSIKRLTLKRAHDWLIDYGMSRDKVKRYKNVIECRELIKDLSDSLTENGLTTKMSKTRTTEQYYRLQCQKVFDLHSRVYSKQVYESDESDEEEEEEEESDTDLEEWGQDLEAMLLENKSLEQIQYEREEKERKEWIKSIKGQKEAKADQTKTKRSFKGQILKISRTYEENGKKFIRHEIVRNPKVIEVYTRIRENKSEEFIQQLSFVKNVKESGLNSTKTKAYNKAVNTLAKPSVTTKTLNGVLKDVSENVSNIRNGFVSNSAKDYEDLDINDDNWDISEPVVEENESLVRVDGSKLKFSKKVVIEANQIEAEEQKLKKQELEEEERSKTVSYYTPRTSNRVRIDPMVKLKDIFDKVILDVRKREELDENIDWFLEPIKKRDVPDYYDIIKNPIDLKTIRERVQRGYYSSREQFLKDIKLIHENCLEYNGECDITTDANKLFEMCREKLDKMADCIEPLEQMYKSIQW